MDQTFTVSRKALFNSREDFARSIFSRLLIILFLGGTVHNLYAQQVTFEESFNNLPMGELPEGWTSYSFNGVMDNNWGGGTYGFFGPEVMVSHGEYAAPGEVDEDWLVTPQITPVAGDFLIFDAAQEFVWDDLGSTFHILISTTTPSYTNFTETLQSWTEPEFPGYLYDQRITIDLSAYTNTPIYIAFVHKNTETGEVADPEAPMPPSESIYLDNIAVRPIKPVDYNGAEIYGSSSSVLRLKQSNTTVIIGLIVKASGDSGDAVLSALKFTTAQTSPLLKIKEAILYTTYADAFIATDDEQGIVWADVYGAVTDPQHEFTIEGNQVLAKGDNYFWLMYTIEADESQLTYPYPIAGATFETVVVNGVEHNTTVGDTEGAHPVVPNSPINDNYANAIEIAALNETVRYGSYNYKATYETKFEKLAYCATPIYATAKDGANSVWWHFKAPADGTISVDLSESDFNTLLLIQDGNDDQVACNKDIDVENLIFQSKITDFPVGSQKDYYIRVSGEGDYPGDPNTESGVVHMDFTYNVPLGIENETDGVTSLYPNPAADNVTVDLFLQSPHHIVLEIVDLFGRTVKSHAIGGLTSGMHEQIVVPVTSLQPGTYLVRMKGMPVSKAKKLLIIRK